MHCSVQILRFAGEPELADRLFADVLRNAVERFRNAAGDRGERVAVAADGNGGTDRVLKGSRFEKRFDRLRNCALTGLVELVGRTDLVNGEIERVVVLLDKGADLPLAVPGTRQEDRARRRFRALDAFRMVVRDDSDSARKRLDFFERLPRPAAGADAHRSTVAEAAVRMRVSREHPL